MQKSTVKRQHFDLLSCLLIAIMFIGLVVGFSNLSNTPLTSLRSGGMILIGLVAMGLLSWRSLTITQPVLDFRLFRNHRFAGHVLVFFLTQMCSLGFAFLLPNYIQLVNHNTALIAGLIVMPAGIGGAVFAPIGGHLLDKFDPRKPITTGAGLMLIAILSFTLAAHQLSNLFITTVYVVYMVGMGMMMGTVMTSALAVLPTEQTPQGNAILNTLQQFAGSMGTSLVAMIVAKSQVGVGKTPTATAMGTGNALIMMLVFAIIIFGGVLKFIPHQHEN